MVTYQSSLQNWNFAINHERLANLELSWKRAIPVTIKSLKKTRKGYKLTIYSQILKNWVKKGEWVSLGINPQTNEIIEGRILEKNEKTNLCALQLDQFKIEEMMSKNPEQWLLPFSSIPYFLMHKQVNQFQDFKDNFAIQFLLKDKIDDTSLKIIQGPPGTGKTTRIGEICSRIFDEMKNKRLNNENTTKVLLTAFTHRACVNIVEKLDEIHVPHVAINLHGLPEHLRNKYELNLITERIQNRINNYNPSNYFKNRQKREIQRQTLNQISFIVCTAMTALNQYPITHVPYFQLTIVDEGSQIVLPILSGVAALTQEMMIFGDPMQLPPVVISPNLGKKEKFRVNPLTKTIYDKIPDQKIQLLEKQYRGRPEIFLLVSALFYEGKIRTGQYIPRLCESPVIEFIDSSNGNLSENKRINTHEAFICQEVIDQIARKIVTHSSPLKIGIISPFRSQAAYLRQILQKPSENVSLETGTVHVTQGRTYDCLILSLAANNFTPFLNPPDDWIRNLLISLPKIFHRLREECTPITKLNYPDFTKLLDKAFISWQHQLEPYKEKNKETNPKLSIRLFEDIDEDFNFDLESLPQLPENLFAPNILNVALSRARKQLVVVGHYEALHLNPIVNLIHKWSEIFGQVKSTNSNFNYNEISEETGLFSDQHVVH